MSESEGTETRKRRMWGARATALAQLDVGGEAGGRGAAVCTRGRAPRQAPTGSLRPCLNGEQDVYPKANCKRKKPRADSTVRRKL